jgi:hypothetical protein
MKTVVEPVVVEARAMHAATHVPGGAHAWKPQQSNRAKHDPEPDLTHDAPRFSDEDGKRCRPNGEMRKQAMYRLRAQAQALPQVAQLHKLTSGMILEGRGGCL